MTTAIDTNVLVRLLVDDDPRQSAAAKALLSAAEAAGSPVIVPLLVILETAWVLGSRYKHAKPMVIQALQAVLEATDAAVEDEATLEEALHLWKHHAADFADCLIAAKAARLGCTRFATFDEKAAKLPGAELLA